MRLRNACHLKWTNCLNTASLCGAGFGHSSLLGASQSKTAHSHHPPLSRSRCTGLGELVLRNLSERQETQSESCKRLSPKVFGSAHTPSFVTCEVDGPHTAAALEMLSLTFCLFWVSMALTVFANAFGRTDPNPVVICHRKRAGLSSQK